MLDLSLGPEAKLRPSGGQPCAQRPSRGKWNPEKAVGAPLPKPGLRPAGAGCLGVDALPGAHPGRQGRPTR